MISTQVIEAGLDRSFDVLVTEAAPASALIQRAGRVARYGGQGEVFVFPYRGGVYNREDVEAATRVLRDGGRLDEGLLATEASTPKIRETLRYSLNYLTLTCLLRRVTPQD